MSTLSGPRRNARAGETSSLVVLLHGYGADGNDLMPLAGPLGEHLPGTAFRAPNAPEPCLVNPAGFQWFPIPWMDGSSEKMMEDGYRRSFEALDAWLSTAMAEEGVGPERTAVVGFSQGTMMALSVLPQRDEAVAGIVGFSGRVIDPPGLARARAKAPVLLIHGDRDEVVPVTLLSEAETELRAAGFEVASHISRGIGHGIAEDGLALASEFLKRHLNGDGRATRETAEA